MVKIIKRETSDVKIYAKTLEDKAYNQIKELSLFKPYLNSKIRIMPDCHAGAGCTIGTTMTIQHKITPNLVGVDIGCGMLTIELEEKGFINLEHLDKIINKYIPNGLNVHKKPQANFDFSRIICKKHLNINRGKLALGSLGGGNHFIEVGKNSNGNLFLVIHSGSRNIGYQVANYYQKVAINSMLKNSNKKDIIDKLKSEGREQEIAEELKKIKQPNINKELAYLTGSDFDNYLHDMKIMQEYASLNRRVIADIILNKTDLTEKSSFETIHNYIDFKRMILRKGAISAEKGEKVLIPINMRDGSIIAIGKGNPDWNYSAPHGAGRLMGRKEAFKRLNLDVFKEQMLDVYSSSVGDKTLDEAPDAYKSIDEILEAITDTVDVVDIIKPIYNFKAH